MLFAKRSFNPRVARANQLVERGANRAMRSFDAVMGALGLGGRRAQYDDSHYEFVGGASDELRTKHYDKSLRLLWKGERALPWSTFRDASVDERALDRMHLDEEALKETALRSLSDDEKRARAFLASDEFRALIDREYSPAEKKAICRVLAAIGHGEAYAWLVSASLLPELKSTGAKAAVTMQVVEEAKHFVVLRELVQALGVEVPKQSAWEYWLLEGTLRARPFDRFFGMNVLVETIALSIFGLLSDKPGFEVLRLFHLDEARHTALPANYFKEFPQSPWQRNNPLAKARRLLLALPALPLIMYLEPELAELGVDSFEFGGSIIRKAVKLADRAGFTLPGTSEQVLRRFNALLNAYCFLTRPGHTWREFTAAETTHGAKEMAVEAAMLEAEPAAAHA